MQFIGVLVKALAMGTFQVAGVVRPRVAGQPLIHRDTINNLVNGVLLYALKLGVLIWALARLDQGWVDLSWLPTGPAQFIFAFVLLDFTRYWVHYADHRLPWLWHFHRVHHSAERLDATTGLRMHVVDFCQLALIPVVLFGVLFNGKQLEAWVVPAALAVADVMDAFEHANVKMDRTSPLVKAWSLLFNSPSFHCWHHTRDGALCDGNYSNTLVIWDRLFGTDVTQVQPPALYGISGDQALENTVLGMQLLRRRQEAPVPERAVL